MLPYNVIFTEQEEYLRVEISGERIIGKEIESASVVWPLVAEKGREKGIFRILAIYRLSGSLPVFAAYFIVESAKDYGWSRRFKLAIVETNEESRKGNQFAELVALNRGYQVKVFDNEDKAKEWLLG